MTMASVNPVNYNNKQLDMFMSVIVAWMLWVQLATFLPIALWSVPQEETHAWHHKYGQELMFGKLIDPRN